MQKIALLARDRPLVFFLLGLSVLLSYFMLAISVLAAILHSLPETFEANEIVLVILCVLPILPVFIVVSLLFVEWSFNLVGVGRLIGLDKKPVLNWFLRRTGAKPDPAQQ